MAHRENRDRAGGRGRDPGALWVLGVSLSWVDLISVDQKAAAFFNKMAR